METDLAARLRAICLALPEVTERPSHGAPTFFVRDKKSFVTLWASGHHDNDFPHLWCAGLPGAQAELVASSPDRFFRPPYVGGRGWIGVRLGGAVDWAEIAELCEDAYRAVAPARLTALLRETRLPKTRLLRSRLVAERDMSRNMREGCEEPRVPPRNSGYKRMAMLRPRFRHTAIRARRRPRRSSHAAARLLAAPPPSAAIPAARRHLR